MTQTMDCEDWRHDYVDQMMKEMYDMMNQYPKMMSNQMLEGRMMGRAGQRSEVAPADVFLTSKDSSYITRQVIHPNNKEVVYA